MNLRPSVDVTYSRLWALAWPMLLTNITVPLVGLVDTAVLGHLDSPRYLGAVAVGANLFTILYWSFGFLRMGTTGMAAQAEGAAAVDALRRLLIQSMVLGLGLGLVLLLLQWPLIQLGISLMNPAPQVAELAVEYCEIRIYSAPAVLAQYAIVGWLIGRQDTRAALYVAVATNLVNLFLDLLFVVGLGMTSDGVALASLFAEGSAFAFGLWLIRTRHPQFWSQLALDRGIRHWPDYLHLIRVNRYIFVRTILLLLTFAFFTAQGARLGTEILAANAILMTFLLLISNGLDGFANAAEVLTGEAVGARRVDHLQRSIRLSLICAGWGALLFSGFFFMAGDHLIQLLTDLPDIAQAARTYLPWLMAMPLFAVWGYMLDGIFIGATQVRAMQNTMAVSVCAFLLLWWASQDLGNHGLWLALLGFMAIRGASMGWICWRYTRQQRWFELGEAHRKSA